MTITESTSPATPWEKTIDNFRKAKASGSPYWHAGEMVPVSELQPYREYDRKTQQKYPGHFDGVKSYIEKHGIDDMGILIYNPETKRVYAGEGNTRLAVAKELGFTHVPMRVYRMHHSNRAGATAPKSYPADRRVPPDIKPSEIGFNSMKFDDLGEAWYHGTSKARASAIRQQGIRPTRGEINGMADPYSPAVCVTTDKDWAGHYAGQTARKDASEPEVLKVNFDHPALRGLPLEVDDESLTYDPDEVPHAYKLHRAIPPDAIDESALEEGRYVYHGTSSKYLHKIRNEGLKPGNRKNSSDPALVHITNDPHIASEEASYTVYGDVSGKPGVGGDPVIVKLDRFHPSFRACKPFRADSNYHIPGATDMGPHDIHSFAVNAHIPPEAIVSVHHKAGGRFSPSLGPEYVKDLEEAVTGVQIRRTYKDFDRHMFRIHAQDGAPIASLELYTPDTDIMKAERAYGSLETWDGSFSYQHHTGYSDDAVGPILKASPKVVSQAMKVIAHNYPNLKVITGHRVTGAHQKYAKPGDDAKFGEFHLDRYRKPKEPTVEDVSVILREANKILEGDDLMTTVNNKISSVTKSVGQGASNIVTGLKDTASALFSPPKPSSGPSVFGKTATDAFNTVKQAVSAPAAIKKSLDTTMKAATTAASVPMNNSVEDMINRIMEGTFDWQELDRLYGGDFPKSEPSVAVHPIDSADANRSREVLKHFDYHLITGDGGSFTGLHPDGHSLDYNPHTGDWKHYTTSHPEPIWGRGSNDLHSHLKDFHRAW